MGCLLEFFIEVFVEGIFELAFYCYLKLMQLIVPEKSVTEKAKRVIKNTIKVIACLLFLTVLVGLVFLTETHSVLHTIGKYLTFIPLGIIALEIVLSIVFKLVSHCKTKKPPL